MGELLNEQIEGQVREVFSELKDPIHVLFFGKEDGCDYCADTRQLLSEVTALSDKISFSTYDVEQDAELARQYHVDKTPGIVIAGMEDGKTVDYGIRYAGIPAGHEFTSLINDFIMVSKRDSSLGPEARKYLAGLDKPVHMQVFVTPT